MVKGSAKKQYFDCREIALAFYNKGYTYKKIHEILKQKGLFSFSYHTIRQYLLLDPDFKQRKKTFRQRPITREEIKEFMKSKKGDV